MSKGLPFDLAEGEDVPDLYTVLGARRDATDEELRKAYRKRALLTHPDKWAHLDPASEEAQSKTQEFQKIGFAYSILKDTKKRKVYDQTGSVDDILDVAEEGKDWDAYFRELWSGVVDASTIEQFAKSYKGSDEERRDILAAYKLHDGDVDLIFTEVMLAEVEDEERFIGIIEQAIKDKDIKRTRKYTKTKQRSKERAQKAAEEAAEAEALRKELGLDDKLRKIKGDKKSKRKRDSSGDAEKEEDDDDDDDDEGDEGAIKALIRQRTTSRMSAIIANIEEKYTAQATGKKNGKKSKKGRQQKQPAAFSEPSEEEFQALQAKLFGKK
ncbi:DnaJ-domain-containing protein [Martensiomyces pterosporus]|nr:DnaJ-domain-containing protein [Martensiomyces pterosporus]